MLKLAIRHIPVSFHFEVSSGFALLSSRVNIWMPFGSALQEYLLHSTRMVSSYHTLQLLQVRLMHMSCMAVCTNNVS